jgi:flagellar biosynthesis regulator FlbT
MTDREALENLMAALDFYLERQAQGHNDANEPLRQAMFKAQETLNQAEAQER